MWGRGTLSSFLFHPAPPFSDTTLCQGGHLLGILGDFSEHGKTHGILWNLRES